MTTSPKRPQGARKSARGAAPEPKGDDTFDTMIRGLTPEDMAALERATARRKRTLDASMPGVYLSRNAVLLSLLRAAMAAEDAAESEVS
jgi:hypothetical protein